MYTRYHIQKQRHYFANKGSSSQGSGFSCGHVWMWELDCEEGWSPKNWCFWTVVLEKTLESPLDCKEIQPVHPKGNQSWVFIGRTDAEAETPRLWPPDAKSWLIWKDPDAGKDWRWEENGTTEDDMFGWHHWLSGHELSKLWELLMGREAWSAAVYEVTRVRYNWATELIWTTLHKEEHTMLINLPYKNYMHTRQRMLFINLTELNFTLVTFRGNSSDTRSIHFWNAILWVSIAGDCPFEFKDDDL